MNRREFLVGGTCATAVSFALGRSLSAQATPAAGEELVYVSAKSGADTNAGTKQAPFKSLEAAAKRVNALTRPGPTTVVVDEGTYARSTGHAMRNCLALNSYATGVWTSGIASDFDFQNNVIANGNHVWIGQGARSASAEIAGGAGRGDAPGQRGGRGNTPPPGRGAAGADVPVDPANRYRVRNSLFAGNKKFTGTGGGPALNFRDNDPSFLELIDTVRTDQPIQAEMEQSKRNYLPRR